MIDKFQLGDLVRVMFFDSTFLGKHGVVVNILHNMSMWRSAPAPSDEVMYEVLIEDGSFYFNWNELELL